MKVKEIIIALAIIAFATFGLSFIASWVPTNAKTQWCPKGQQAVVVDSGYDAHGTPTVLYACDTVKR